MGHRNPQLILFVKENAGIIVRDHLLQNLAKKGALSARALADLDRWIGGQTAAAAE